MTNERAEPIGEAIRKAIDRRLYEAQGKGDARSHLGFSVIGKECARAVWYSWRWFTAERHSGRMIRLFRRGHDEEPRLVEWLAQVGAVVQATDPATGKQWLASDIGGHFGGSCDGKIGNLDSFGLPGWGVLECKTHNDKSFRLLETKGVATSKPSHYIQAQMYMAYFGLPWCLYVGVNKNDDDLYIEVIYAKPEIAAGYRARAVEIIESMQPPKRIREQSSYFVCKMCPHHEVCFYPKDHTPKLNCRTCVNSIPDQETGEWFCAYWQQPIPKAFQEKGCDQWQRRA